MNAADESKKEIIDAAARWDARLRSSRCTADERAAFRVWEEANPEHAATFERLQAILEAARTLGDHARIRALRDDALLRYRLSTRRRAMIGWAAAASLAAVLFLSYSKQNDPTVARTMIADVAQPQGQVRDRGSPAPIPADPARSVRTYQTDANERTEARLEDGSTVVLNASTRIITRFTGTRRYVEMLGGQAFFRVSKDRMRPFVVRAGDREVIAVGTAFEVRLEKRSLDVTLLEGRVVVKPIGEGPAKQEILLAPDQRVIINGNAAPIVKSVNSGIETGWTEGRLYFDDTPLNDAVEQMNRYSAVKVELGDRSLATYRVSGMFRMGSQASFVEALQQYFPITPVRRSEKLVVLMPAVQSGPEPAAKK